MVGETNTVPVKNAQPAAAQPATATTTPVTPVTGEPKKSIFKSWWLWTIIAIIIIVGAYFIFF